MCGIIGYSGKRKALPIIVEGLARLEYRGYDSAGIAIVNSEITVFKKKGEISALREIVEDVDGCVGIGHTRWATHGEPSDKNAHPMLDCHKRIAVVHNGIIENYISLKETLIKNGHVFTSDTDSEVIPHLLEEYYSKNLLSTLIKIIPMLRGSFAFVVITLDEPEKVVGVRYESPLIVGLGKDENFLSSDIPAVLSHTKNIVHLRNYEIAQITPNSTKFYNFRGEIIRKMSYVVEWDLKDAEKGGYPHFMLKEIHEQPKAILETLIGRIPELNIGIENILQLDFSSIKLIGCGTSYHACLLGKYLIETLAGIPSSAEIASEYRYMTPTDEDSLAIFITQSGETADTLRSARDASKRGLPTIGITNVEGSSITKEVDGYILTRAGPEIGVAATKTFTTQIVVLYLIAFYLAMKTGKMTGESITRLVNEMRRIPKDVRSVLDGENAIKLTAEWIADARDVYYIGRYMNYPLAMEGALKLKEISYIHAEGLPAGELKHGPNALLSKNTPVIAICIKDHTYEKMLANILEVAARKSPIIVICSEDDREIKKTADVVLTIPNMSPLFAPCSIAVVVQLLAYYVARKKNLPIDKPRNLAKSVTVE